MLETGKDVHCRWQYDTTSILLHDPQLLASHLCKQHNHSFSGRPEHTEQADEQRDTEHGQAPQMLCAILVNEELCMIRLQPWTLLPCAFRKLLFADYRMTSFACHMFFRDFGTTNTLALVTPDTNPLVSS